MTVSIPKHLIVLLPGDGIGPEVIGEARKILNVMAEKRKHVVEFEFREELIGGSAIDATGEQRRAIEVKVHQKTKTMFSIRFFAGSFGGFGRNSTCRAGVPPEQASLSQKRPSRPASSRRRYSSVP